MDYGSLFQNGLWSPWGQQNLMQQNPFAGYNPFQGGYGFQGLPQQLPPGFPQGDFASLLATPSPALNVPVDEPAPVSKRKPTNRNRLASILGGQSSRDTFVDRGR